MPKNLNTTVQDDFGLFPRTAYKGALADGSYQNNISIILEGNVAPDFGDAMCGGTEDGVGLPFDGSSTYFVGVRFRNFGRTGVSIGQSGYGTLEDGDTILLMDSGVLWVEASNSITAGEQAALTTDNKWSGGAAEGTYLVSGATFLTSGDEGELVKLKLTGQKTLTLIEAAAAAAPTPQSEQKTLTPSYVNPIIQNKDS